MANRVPKLRIDAMITAPVVRSGIPLSYFEPAFDRVKATIDRRHGGVPGDEAAPA